MLLQYSKWVLFSFAIAKHKANAHGGHEHHHHHSNNHHDNTQHHHGNLRHLNIFDASTSSKHSCKYGEPTYTVGGVTYDCLKDFHQKGGQCRSRDRTDEEEYQAKENFKFWKDEKKKGKGGGKGEKKGRGGGRRLAEGCGDCVDWDNQIITVPTYFHVMHDGNKGKKYRYDENPKYIQDQIKAINIGFRGDESDFSPNENGRSYNRYSKVDADTKIQFCLMGTTAKDKKDYYSDKKESDMKEEFRVGGMETLNVYVNTAGGYLGYAYYPEKDYFVLDGVVILGDTMPGGDEDYYDEGDTLTHEIGHWLNLAHTHSESCKGPGDYMDDAPLSDRYVSEKATEDDPSFDCPVNLDNCDKDGGKPNPIHSFMSYVDDNCMDQFTPGQVVNMQSAWELYRHKENESEFVTLDSDGYSCTTGPPVASSSSTTSTIAAATTDTTTSTIAITTPVVTTTPDATTSIAITTPVVTTTPDATSTIAITTPVVTTTPDATSTIAITTPVVTTTTTTTTTAKAGKR